MQQCTIWNARRGSWRLLTHYIGPDLLHWVAGFISLMISSSCASEAEVCKQSGFPHCVPFHLLKRPLHRNSDRISQPFTLPYPSPPWSISGLLVHPQASKKLFRNTSRGDDLAPEKEMCTGIVIIILNVLNVKGEGKGKKTVKEWRVHLLCDKKHLHSRVCEMRRASLQFIGAVLNVARRHWPRESPMGGSQDKCAQQLQVFCHWLGVLHTDLLKM